MEYVQILLLLLAFYECVTVPVYLRTLYILFRKNKFHLPFYWLITVVGILDLAHFSLEFCFFRLSLLHPFIEWFSALPTSQWIAWIRFGIYFCTYQQFSLHFIISANRLSAICFPLKQKMFWTRAWPWFVCAFAIAALGLGSDLLFAHGKFMPLVSGDPSKGVMPSPTHYNLHQLDQSLITITLGAVCTILCLLANLSALLLAWRSKKKANISNAGGKISRLELNFLLVAVCMMVPQIVVVAFHILLRSVISGQMLAAYLSAGQNKTLFIYTMMSQMPWVDDLYSLSHPWILLCICSDLRKAVFRPFLGKTEVTTKVISLKPIATTTLFNKMNSTATA